MAFCAKCGASLSDNVSFCGQCGTPVKRSSEDKNNSGEFTLLISRAKQYLFAVGAYDVYINGELLGRIPVGQTIAVRVFSDTVRVEIKCATIVYTKFKKSMTLKLKNNPRIDFHLTYPAAINAAVTGAEVLEESN